MQQESNTVTETYNTNSSAETSARLMSLFDALGPVMTGPSSSHTAGIARIGRMGRQFAGGTPESVELHFYGALAHTYRGHCSDAAVVGGLIGLTEDSPELGDALKLAAAKGIAVRIVTSPDSDINPNTVDMRLTRAGTLIKVVGISVGGGEILMTEYENFPLCLYGNEDALMIDSCTELDVANLREILGDNLVRICTERQPDRILTICSLCTPASPQQVRAATGLKGVARVEALNSIYEYRLRDSKPLFKNFAELLALCDTQQTTIPELAIAFEGQRSGLSRKAIFELAAKIWDTMVRSYSESLQGNNRLVAGFMPGNDGSKLMALVQQGKNVSGNVMGTAVARAIATMEHNGCMGCVAAAPTAGSCGVMPGALSVVAENLGAEAARIHEALLAGAVVGVLVAMRAPVSGALGGCQSEIGVASAMTAAAMTQLAGGTPLQVVHAFALALKNILGLVCDPVAGPVEIPCIKRNGIGVGNAMAAADMALANIESIIPPDEVIDALINVQHALPRELRGTLTGGLACTKTAIRLKKEWDERMAQDA